MYWYFMENGQQHGPLSEEEFEDSIRSGKITSDTLIWHEGMTGWKTYVSEKSPNTGDLRCFNHDMLVSSAKELSPPMN